jgi:Rod binding domain-containing protein
MSADSIVSGVLSAGLAVRSPLGASDNPQKIREAALQFEALLIGQVLKTVHQGDESWMGTGEDQTASSAMELADEYFAQALAARGGLGLARMVAAGLERRASSGDSQQSQSREVTGSDRLEP